MYSSRETMDSLSMDSFDIKPHGTASTAWAKYHAWRRDEIERQIYKDSDRKYQELLAFTASIPSKKHREAWCAFAQSNEVMDTLRNMNDGMVFYMQLQHLLTRIHYGAYVNKTEKTEHQSYIVRKFRKLLTCI